MQYEFVKSTKEGRSGVKTPYNQEFVDELKLHVPSAKWNGAAWFFDDTSQPDVEILVEKYWPSDADSYRTVRITWELDRSNPAIDGVKLASVSRDNWKWRNDCPISFRVIEADNLQSGGSRKSPGLYGTLVIESLIRDGAKITPEPVSVDVIVDAQTPNPLEKFSTEELSAELKRREAIPN